MLTETSVVQNRMSF